MNSKLSFNYFYNLVYQFLAISLPIITVPYVSRTLGVSSLGKYYYISAIVSYFGIFAVLGTTNYGQREIAKQQENKIARSRLFWDILYFRTICTLITFVIYIFFIIFFPLRYRSLLLVNVFSFMGWILDVSWYFQGMENFKITAIRNGLVKILATALIFILIKSPKDVVLYAFIYILATLIGNITMIPYLKKEIFFKRFKIKEILKHFKGILSLFFPVIAIQLYTVLNRIMLGALSTNDQVSYFSQIMMIVNLSLSVMSAFVGVLTPHIANLYSKGHFKEIKYLTKLGINFVYLLGLPMMLGCLVCGSIFVPIFFGDQYNPAIPVLYILSLLFVILGFGQILGSFLISINRQNKYTIAVSLAALVNLIFNFIFLMFFQNGAIGVSISTIIAEGVSTLVQVYYLRDLLNISNFLKGLLHYGIISVIAVIPISFIITIWISNKTLELVLIVGCSTVFYFIILIICKDKTFTYIFAPIFNQLKDRMKNIYNE